MALPETLFRLLLLAGIGATYLAIIFVIVGLTTNFWLEIRDSNVHRDDVEMHFGLHRVCWSKSDKCNNPTGNYDKSNYLPKIQGLVITGAVFGLFASILSLVHFCSEILESRMKAVTIATMACCLLSGLFIMIGCAIFGEKVEISHGYGTMFDRHVYLSYSFGLTTCAGGLMWVGALLIAFANFCGKAEDMRPYPSAPSAPPSVGYPSAPPSIRYPSAPPSIRYPPGPPSERYMSDPPVYSAKPTPSSYAPSYAPSFVS